MDCPDTPLYARGTAQVLSLLVHRPDRVNIRTVSRFHKFDARHKASKRIAHSQRNGRYGRFTIGRASLGSTAHTGFLMDRLEELACS
jgi:hypothetical protein